MNAPLIAVLEKTKMELIQTFNQIIDNSKLPAYLFEGMLLDLLCEIRNRKSMELVSQISAFADNAEADKGNADSGNANE